jgi:hypothetical protein
LRRGLTGLLSLVIGLAAVVGLIAVFNSRDSSSLSRQAAAGSPPGNPYRGQPRLSPDLAAAAKAGNVIVLYRDPRPPPGTDQLVPPGGRALVRAGQSVLLRREASLATPLAAVSADRIQAASAARDLQAFVDYWIGGR